MKKIVAGLLVFMLLAACGTFSGGTGLGDETLIVRRFPSEEILGVCRVGEEKGFSLTFIHSVSGTPVRDDYRIENGKIVQVAETFMTHEAGLPSEVSDPATQRWEHRDGTFILHMKRNISRLVVRTDRNYCNRLVAGGVVTNLNRWEDQALEIVIGTAHP